MVTAPLSVPWVQESGSLLADVRWLRQLQATGWPPAAIRRELRRLGKFHGQRYEQQVRESL